MTTPDPLGTDFSTRTGLTGALVSGRELLLESLARRLRTRRGALWYAPDYGSHLPEYLGEGFADGGREAALLCELDLEEDERVRSANVTVTAVSLRGVTLRADLTTADGPFALIVEAAAASGLYSLSLEVTPDGVG